MTTKRRINILKQVSEGEHTTEPDQETIEEYNRLTRRFIRPKIPTTTLIANNSVPADFSFADIVSKEQVENPNIITDDGKNANKLVNTFDRVFNDDDPIFELDDKRQLEATEIPPKVRVKTKKLKTRYNK